jgi:hypothetical protein
MEEVIELTDNDPDVQIIEDHSQYCWCCGYHSDNLIESRTKDKQRKTKHFFICEVCYYLPSSLDAYLNPDLYEDEMKVMLKSISYMGNMILDRIENER